MAGDSKRTVPSHTGFTRRRVPDLPAGPAKDSVQGKIKFDSLYFSAPTVKFVGGCGGPPGCLPKRPAKGQAVLVDDNPTSQASKALADALAQSRGILTKFGFEEIIETVVGRIAAWIASVGDPDDPVGLGATVLIPVDKEVVDLIRANGGPEKICYQGTCLGPDFLGRVPPVELRDGPWDVNIAINFGLLVPPESNGGKAQAWETTYAGEHLENDWAEWKVETQAWPRITW
ncbi:MAG: hypothetical protein ACKOB8_13795 [Mycobacterium sp.]